MNDVTTELKNIRERLLVLENQYNNCADEDLLESCIYEQKSLLCRYRFLYREALKEGVPLDPSFTFRLGVL